MKIFANIILITIAIVLYEVDELFGDTTYNYIFISNNKAIEAISGKEYRLQEK